MSKEKQIEEMAKVMAYGRFVEPNENQIRLFIGEAESLYNAGYRKQSEGKWEIVKGSHGKEIMVCTNCRRSQDMHSTFTYCPNCGAKMKGGAE